MRIISDGLPLPSTHLGIFGNFLCALGRKDSSKRSTAAPAASRNPRRVAQPAQPTQPAESGPGLRLGVVWLSTGTWRGDWWKKTDLLTSAHRHVCSSSMKKEDYLQSFVVVSLCVFPDGLTHILI